jgi:hypothetical protein
MDIAITVVVTLAAAWLAFFWAKTRDDKLRIIELLINLYSGELHAKRARLMVAFKDLDAEKVAQIAARDIAVENDLRTDALSIMNTHDLSAFLYNNKLVDRKIFNRYLRHIIVADFELLSGFRDAIQADFEARGVDSERPFHPEVHAMMMSTP